MPAVGARTWTVLIVASTTSEELHGRYGVPVCRPSHTCHKVQSAEQLQPATHFPRCLQTSEVSPICCTHACTHDIKPQYMQDARDSAGKSTRTILCRCTMTLVGQWRRVQVLSARGMRWPREQRSGTLRRAVSAVWGADLTRSLCWMTRRDRFKGGAGARGHDTGRSRR